MWHTGIYGNSVRKSFVFLSELEGLLILYLTRYKNKDQKELLLLCYESSFTL